MTDIRVRFDDSENQRRIDEENNRLDRYEALQIEAVTSGRKNAAIEMKWADLLNQVLHHLKNSNTVRTPHPPKDGFAAGHHHLGRQGFDSCRTG